MKSSKRRSIRRIPLASLAGLFLLGGCAGPPLQEDPREPLTRPPEPRPAAVVVPDRPTEATAGAGLWIAGATAP